LALPALPKAEPCLAAGPLRGGALAVLPLFLRRSPVFWPLPLPFWPLPPWPPLPCPGVTVQLRPGQGAPLPAFVV